jgi:hypothetical protein
VRYLRVPKNVAYVSEEEGGISVIDLSTLKVIRSALPVGTNCAISDRQQGRAPC